MANATPNNGPVASRFENAYTSFSGVDMKVMCGNRPLSPLQALSVSVTREKAPVYTMGSADPRSFSRGKRGIVGTMVFVIFDRDFPLDPDYGFNAPKPWLDIEEVGAEFVGGDNDLTLSFGDYVGVPVQDAESAISQVGGDQVASNPQYHDQILPVDIVLVGENEYGKRMKMAIGGIEILNQGSGFSIDDVQTESQLTWIGRSCLSWRSVSN